MSEKPLLQNLSAEEMDIEGSERQILICEVCEPRDGWDAAFQAMQENGDDKLLDEEETSSLSRWDKTEWQWQKDKP